MSQYTVEVTTLKKDPNHWAHQLHQIRRCKAMLRRKKAELSAREQAEQKKQQTPGEKLRGTLLRTSGMSQPNRMRVLRQEAFKQAGGMTV